jgi:hypothetical protein
MGDVEVPIHVLLVAFQALKHCGHVLPTISEEVQDICLQRLTATVKFTEGAPSDLVEQMITKSCVDHLERYLLAFVYGHLGRHDLLRRYAFKLDHVAAVNDTVQDHIGQGRIV